MPQITDYNRFQELQKLNSQTRQQLGGRTVQRLGDFDQLLHLQGPYPPLYLAQLRLRHADPIGETDDRHIAMEILLQIFLNLPDLVVGQGAQSADLGLHRLLAQARRFERRGQLGDLELR